MSGNPRLRPRPLVISHAACKGHAPENTLAGIRAAMELGVDAIEIDVHATADGALILLHDDTLARTTDGTGDVRVMTLDEVRRLDAGAKSFDGRFSGERVPTLEEVLGMTRGRCLLIAEVKQGDIEPLLVELVRRMDVAADVMVWSFYPNTVARMRALAPEIPCSVLWPERESDPAQLCATALAANAQAISPSHAIVDEKLIRHALRRGLRVFAWTADDPSDIQRLVNLDVDGICSNYPERVRDAVRM